MGEGFFFHIRPQCVSLGDKIGLFYVLYNFAVGVKHLNPIWPSLFRCIRDLGGGHIVPPLNIFWLGGVRVPILVANDLPGHDLPYSKGFMKFGCLEPSKKMFDF